MIHSPFHDAGEKGSLLVGRYRCDAVLGEGASATVHAALDTQTGARVALKRLKPGAKCERLRTRERFVSEAGALARLHHPHLVRIESVQQDDEGAPFLVMERLTGCTLGQVLHAEGQLDVSECYRWLIPIAGALAAAHDAGIVHRDVKPANLFLHEENGTLIPKLLDFGAAKLDDDDSHVTTSGMAVGTPCYMAPEQAQGLPLGPYTDVWALGVVWFRCLSGRLPFEADTSLGVVIKLSRERAPRLGEVVPELPTALAVALDRALEPEPGVRYPDVRAFARALAHAARQAALDVPTDPEPVALGDWPRWLAEADVEGTAAIATVPPRPAKAPAPEVAEQETVSQPAVVRSERLGSVAGARRWALASAAVVALLALTWWLGRSGAGAAHSEAPPGLAASHLSTASGPGSTDGAPGATAANGVATTSEAREAADATAVGASRAAHGRGARDGNRLATPPAGIDIGRSAGGLASESAARGHAVSVDGELAPHVGGGPDGARVGDGLTSEASGSGRGPVGRGSPVFAADAARRTDSDSRRGLPATHNGRAPSGESNGSRAGGTARGAASGAHLELPDLRARRAATAKRNGQRRRDASGEGRASAASRAATREPQIAVREAPVAPGPAAGPRAVPVANRSPTVIEDFNW